MADLLILLASAILLGGLSFAGGWSLRGTRGAHRADLGRDRAWDEEHGVTGGPGA